MGKLQALEQMARAQRGGKGNLRANLLLSNGARRKSGKVMANCFRIRLQFHFARPQKPPKSISHPPESRLDSMSNYVECNLNDREMRKASASSD